MRDIGSGRMRRGNTAASPLIRQERCAGRYAVVPDCRADARPELARGRPGPAHRAPGRVHQCCSSIFFGFGGDGTFAYWNAGVAFSASFVAPGR